MKNNKLIKIALVVFSALILLLVKPVSRTIDSSLSTTFSHLAGESSPDTNIIIIHINEDDIDQLGPWPIKRSYYALLINKLTELDVRTIGLEIFLSSKFATQVLYDKVLLNEIKNSGKVVLSSLAGAVHEINNKYITDSLSFPSPKLIDNDLRTAHINIINEDGIRIPLALAVQGHEEYAFSLEISGVKTGLPNSVKMNFLSSWKKFRNYSLLDFFDLMQNSPEDLAYFRNKIVLIGISDAQLASVFESPFDEIIPGVALHAFASENIINHTYLRDNLYPLSMIIFPFLVIVFVFLSSASPSRIKYALYLLVVSLIVAFFLRQFLYLDLGYSFFMLPLALILVFEIFNRFYEQKNIVKGVLDESLALRNMLRVKEKELENLEKELGTPDSEKSSSLAERIKSLKSDIGKLKENEKDKVVYESSSESGIKNSYGIVYKSNKMREIVSLIEKTAPTDASILITGESGTGKELVARAIHNLSKRNNKSFIAVNCAAMPDTLLESELFGHTKGSFTGAVSDKIGKFEAADKGTIFLDEIGETSENFQVKLLRVLQTGEVDKIGSVKSDIVDVRVISATNKDLRKRVSEKKFREDLFYRLNVINIDLPPLRERKEDIEALTGFFLSEEDSQLKLSVAAVKCLNENDWKGNVRELESVVKRAVIFCKAAGRDLVQLSDLPDEIVRSVKINFEDMVIESLRAKKFSRSSINETARELGNLNRTVISENLRGYSLKILVGNKFDEDASVRMIAGTHDAEVLEKIRSKLETWLANIKKDIGSAQSDNFEEIKVILNSKYKNLPQKFHPYLDEVIKYFLN